MGAAMWFLKQQKTEINIPYLSNYTNINYKCSNIHNTQQIHSKVMIGSLEK